MNPITLRLLRVGFCRHLECMAISGGQWAPVKFPALCGLIHHSTRGWILYDTGYAEHFFTATESWPERFYRQALPIVLPEAEILKTQLASFGLTPGDIGTVIISHYHGDHIAGLKDFTKARFIALSADTESFVSHIGKRWRSTLGGHLPGLLPNDYLDRVTAADDMPHVALPKWMKPFTTGFDLFGDGSLLGVPLPGHSHGQLGIFIPDIDGRPVFLIADSCWSLPALRNRKMPSRAALFFSADRQRYAATFDGLFHLSRNEPAIALLPSHCQTAWQEFHDVS